MELGMELFAGRQLDSAAVMSRRVGRLRSIKKSLADESEPEQRKHTAKLLSNVWRKLRESLVSPPHKSLCRARVEEDIQLIGMPEDECPTDESDEGPV